MELPKEKQAEQLFSTSVRIWHSNAYTPKQVAGGCRWSCDFCFDSCNLCVPEKIKTQENADGSSIPKETHSENKNDKDGKYLLNPVGEVVPGYSLFYAMFRQAHCVMLQETTTTVWTTNGYPYKN